MRPLTQQLYGSRTVIVFSVMVFFALYVALMSEPDMSQEVEVVAPPMTSRRGGFRQKEMARNEKLPMTGLKMLVPCVPNSVNDEVKGRVFKEKLRACGAVHHLPGANETGVFVYHLATLDKVSPLQVNKCKLALAYHTSLNPLPLWYPVPSATEAKRQIPLSGIWELGL